MVNSLRDIRKESSYRIKDVSDALNIHQNTLLSWENGMRLIPIDQLNRLLKFYDYPLEEFDFDLLLEIHQKKKKKVKSDV